MTQLKTIDKNRMPDGYGKHMVKQSYQFGCKK